MNNDRELLELAAKAAGIDCVWNGDTFEYKPRFEINWIVWNPLTDDGDALRLAVRIVLMYSFYRFLKEFIRAFRSEDYFSADDNCLPTRRAIVRAAAEIGRV